MISRRIVAHLLVVSASAFLFGAEVPLSNWTVPPFVTGSSSGNGITTMTDISPGVGFTAIQPCRVVDTRGGGAFTGLYGPPILAANAIRTFDINSAPHCPGIPAAAEAYSLNFTVTETGGPSGDIRVWPTGNPPSQVTSVLNWTVTNATIANATIVPAGTGGSIDVQVAGSATHLLIDVNGYFTAEQNPGQTFVAKSSTAEPAILGENTSDAIGAVAIRGLVSSPNALLTASAAVVGTNLGQGFGYGVRGAHMGAGIGVEGTSATGYGVRGSSPFTGVLGISSGSRPGFVSYGVWASAESGEPFSAAVRADALSSTGRVYGVDAFSSSNTLDSAGVRAVADAFPNVDAPLAKAGIRGESLDGYGVLGISQVTAVSGLLTNPATGAPIAEGRLGTIAGADPGSGSPPWAVFAQGDIGASGTKHFLDPHPTDPSKAISYISLEGAEAGTYFRGRGKFQNGIARIAVPEDFRLVTDSEGLTVQITPLGGMSTFGVLKVDLDEIVVQASRDLEFSYLVQGVRATFARTEPVISGSVFAPDSADAKMPQYLSDGQKRRLVANGTYRPDGTVNPETARRLGWDRVWAKRSAAKPAPRADSVE